MAKQTMVRTKQKISVENIFLTVTLATASAMVLGVSLAGLLFASEKPSIIAQITSRFQTNAKKTTEVVKVREVAATLQEGVSPDAMEEGLDTMNDLGAVLNPRSYQDANNIPDINLKENILATLASIENYFTDEYTKFSENCLVAPEDGAKQVCFYWNDNLTAISSWYQNVFTLLDDVSTDIAATNTASDLDALDVIAYKKQFDGLLFQYQAIQADRVYDVTNLLQSAYSGYVMDTMYHVKSNDTDNKKGTYQNLASLETTMNSEVATIDATIVQLTTDVNKTCSTGVSSRPKVNVNIPSYCDTVRAQIQTLETEKSFYTATIAPLSVKARSIIYDGQPANFYGKASKANEKMLQVKETLQHLKIQDDGSYPVVTFAVYWNGGEMTAGDETVTTEGLQKSIQKLTDAALAVSESMLYLYDGVVASSSDQEIDVSPYLELTANDLLQTSKGWLWALDPDYISIVAVAASIRATINDQIVPSLQQIIDLFSVTPVQQGIAVPTPSLPSVNPGL